jgi:hypothetical protein
MNTELLHRIRRIYSSIGAAEETDMNNLKPIVITMDEIKAVFQNFRGNLTNAELSNRVHMLIHNIANLHNHLRKWAVQNGMSKEKIDEVFAKSLELRIIKDLSDNDKHGYPPRNGGYSKKYPQLVNINRVMQLKTQAKKNSTIGMTLGTSGAPKSLGDGTAKAIITGDIVDNKNKHIGDLHVIVTKAIEVWEQLLASLEN